MSEENCRPCRIIIQRLSADELAKLCKPCFVNLEKLPDKVFSAGLSGRQVKVRRLNSAQKLRWDEKFFEERCGCAKEMVKYTMRRKIALEVTQRSALRRGRTRRRKFKATANRTTTISTVPQSPDVSEKRHLFLAYSEMLVSLSTGGDASFLLGEDESLIVNSLLDLPNPVRAKIVQYTARKSGSWVRVDFEEISITWLDRLAEAGIINVATDYPGEFADILETFTVQELKKMCKKAGLSCHFSKQSLIRELTITQYLDVNVLQLSPEKNELYDTRRIIRVVEPVRQLIIKTAHLFVLPIKDSNLFWTQSNPIYKIVHPCLPLNPKLKSIKFDGYSKIFKNNEEFSRWAEARETKFMLQKAITRKKWDAVESTVLSVSMRQLYNSLLTQCQSLDDRPEIFRQFTEKNVDIGTLSLGVEALISSNTNLQLAEEVLHGLLNQPNCSSGDKCSWRYLLALIFEKVSKPDKAADMALYAGRRACGNCDTCRTKLTQLCKRLSVIDQVKASTTSELIKCADDDVLSQPTIVINRKSSGKGFPGLKSVYSIIKNGTKLHLSVEEYVMEHFNKNGYPQGLDDEGRSIMNLCNLVIWEHTYSKDVPNVFCAPWQSAPLDWGTQEFWRSRKSQLEDELGKVSEMTAEQLSSYLVEKRNVIGRVSGTVDWNYVNFDPKGMLTCMTVPLFVAICKRLISGGYQARRGFPDLLLWNEEDKKCLFVEVKGPNDKLSSLQRFWLEFINDSRGQAVVVDVQK